MIISLQTKLICPVINITVTDICRSVTTHNKMPKTSWHRYRMILRRCYPVYVSAGWECWYVIARSVLPFQQCSHINNIWSDNKKVTSSKDGQVPLLTVSYTLCQGKNIFKLKNSSGNFEWWWKLFCMTTVTFVWIWHVWSYSQLCQQ